MTAAAAAVTGMRCVLVLTATTEQPAIAGNLLLDKLYGAEIRLVPSIDPMLAVGQDEAVVAEVVAEEQAAGRVPYVIPVGGSSGVGVCGYVSGSAELVEQLSASGIAASRLYYASGSRGTQAGLTLGATVMRRAVSGLRCCGQRRRAGEDRACQAHRQRSGRSNGVAGASELWRIWSPTRGTSAKATASPPSKHSRRSSYWRGPKRSCSIRVTRRKRWPR